MRKNHADPEVLKLQEERAALQRKIKEGEAWERKLGLFNKFMENVRFQVNDIRCIISLGEITQNEPERVGLLRDKWRTATKEILSTLRDSIGAVVIPEGPGLTREALLLTDMAPEVRLLTLQEVCCSFRFDIAILGSYNENDDCFDD